MPVLHVITSDGRIFKNPLNKDRVRLGRSKDNDLVLGDNTVSRHHAEIYRANGGYLISDLGSYNGTKVNGKLVQTFSLSHEDEIQIGLTKILFLEEGQEHSLAANTVIFTSDMEEEERESIIKSSPLPNARDSRELIAGLHTSQVLSSRKNMGIEEDVQSGISELERRNKALFVLYEISRQLNEIHDFNELLKKIMDLIFLVIDADYGFLLLIGDEKGEELLPIVIKYGPGIKKVPKEIKASRTLIKRVIKDKVALLVSNALEDSILNGAKSVLIQNIKSAMCVPLWRKDKIIGVIQLDSIRLANQFTNEDLELLKTIASQMALVIEQAALNEQIRQEELMRSRLERFHSPQVIEMILKASQDTKDNLIEPKEVTATILFTDIVDFTHLSEKIPPREITVILNHYFSVMTDIVFKYGGTLDKYIGDGLMAVFGAPMQLEDDAQRAIKAALEMRQSLGTMMKKISKDKRFDIRIGINTGKVVAGNIGSPKRMDYTVIGDPVNLASRLETMAAPNQILIGEETYKNVKDKFEINQIGLKKIKGKTYEIMVYEVIG